MEFSNHGGGDTGAATGGSSTVSFFYLPSCTTNNTNATVAPPPGTAVYEFRNYYQTLKTQGAGPSQYATKQRETVSQGGNGDQGEIVCTGEMDRIKAKIMSHPQYSSLLGAYLECQKVTSLCNHRIHLYISVNLLSPFLASFSWVFLRPSHLRPHM